MLIFNIGHEKESKLKNYYVLHILCTVYIISHILKIYVNTIKYFI